MIPVKNCYNYFWLCQYCFYSGPRLERTLVHSHSLRNYLDQRVRICYQKLASLEDIRVKIQPKQLLWPQEYQGFQFLQVTLLNQSLTTHWNLNVRVRGDRGKKLISTSCFFSKTHARISACALAESTWIYPTQCRKLKSNRLTVSRVSTTNKMADKWGESNNVLIQSFRANAKNKSIQRRTINWSKVWLPETAMKVYSDPPE